MIFSDSPQQGALERMMTAVPRFRPKGGGIMVLHHFEYTAEMCDCRYCPYYRGKRKCTASHCPCIEERILVGAASPSEVMAETMKDIHNAAFRRRLKLFFRWGIKFDKDHPYTVAENGNRKVQYAHKAELMDGIVKKYHPEALLEGDASGEGGEMAEPKQAEAKNHQPPKRNTSRSRQPKPLPESTEKDGKKGGSQPSEKQMTAEPEPEHVPQGGV